MLMQDVNPSIGGTKRRGNFPKVLREARENRQLSQSRLAAAAGFDHSYVSRLETGTRSPTREAVVKLADAMNANDGERDLLLHAAGFSAKNMECIVFACEPLLAEIYKFLQDDDSPEEVKEDMRTLLASTLRVARSGLPR